LALSVGQSAGPTREARSSWLERDYDVSADGQSIYLARTPDLLRSREVRVVVDWASEVDFARRSRRRQLTGGVR